MHHGTHVPHYLVKCSQHQFISAVNISKQNSMLSWGKFFNSPKCIFLLTQFCFENQWQIIVFLRHPVPCSIWSWSRAKLFPRVSSLSEAHCSFQGCLWSCNGCGAHYISNTNITTNEALKFEILALIVICLPAYLGISEFDTKFWHKL